MANILRFLNGRHLIEQFLTEDSIAGIRVNGEVANAEARQILEEVRSLRGVYVVVLQTCLYNNPSSRDMRPFHGYAKPIVTTASTAWANKDVVLPFIQELAVQLFYLGCNHGVIGGGEVIVGLDVNDIYDFF